jgi:hypothetical protein
MSTVGLRIPNPLSYAPSANHRETPLVSSTSQSVLPPLHPVAPPSVSRSTRRWQDWAPPLSATRRATDPAMRAAVPLPRLRVAAARVVPCQIRRRRHAPSTTAPPTPPSTSPACRAGCHRSSPRHPAEAAIGRGVSACPRPICLRVDSSQTSNRSPVCLSSCCWFLLCYSKMDYIFVNCCMIYAVEGGSCATLAVVEPTWRMCCIRGP